MAHRTTVLLSPEEVRALRTASRAQGVSSSELIRRGIRAVTGLDRARRPTVGWLKLSREERASIARDDFGDRDG